MTVPDVRDERPTYGITAQNPPPKLRHDDRDALKAYANLARWLYPGPVGAWIARDLEAIAQFGYRFANPSLLGELLAELDVERERRAERVAEAARAAFQAPRSESGCERRSTPGLPAQPVATQTSACGESGGAQ